MSENLIVRTENLIIGYKGKEIVKDINISLEKGKIISLIGPNGAGKTTLIRTLSGILPPVSGKIFVYSGGKEKDLFEMKETERAEFAASVLTDKYSAELMTCWDMVSMGRYPYTGRMGALSEEDKEKVLNSMKITGITELAKEEFSKLSDGQKQRVLLARAICQEPELLILDEPTSFLDIKYKMDFLVTLKKLAKELGFSVIVSIHELDMAKQISDQFICLKNGKIDRLGQKEDVFSGGYIQELFSIETGYFDEKTGLGIIDGL